MKIVLSVQGGGIRGVASLTFLAKLEEVLGVSVYNVFDLFCGASVGAVIAAGLALGIPPKDILAIIQKEVSRDEIFKKGKTYFIPIGPKYTAKSKRDLVDSVVPDVTICGKQYHPGMGREFRVRDLMIPLYCTETAKTVLFKSYCEEHSSMRLRDLVDAATAAPVYFPPTRIGKQNFIDCGIAMVDPCVCALSEARERWPGERVKILNLGTGKFHTKIEPSPVYGMYHWMRSGLIHIMIDAPNDATEEHCRKICGKDYLLINSSIENRIRMDDVSEANLHYLKVLGLKWFLHFREEVTDFLSPRLGRG